MSTGKGIPIQSNRWTRKGNELHNSTELEDRGKPAQSGFLNDNQANGKKYEVVWALGNNDGIQNCHYLSYRNH